VKPFQFGFRRPERPSKPDPVVTIWYAADGAEMPVTNTADGVAIAVARGLTRHPLMKKVEHWHSMVSERGPDDFPPGTS